MSDGCVPHERVRVAYFVSPSAHFAGIERVVHELATGLATGHGSVLDVHVIYSSPYGDVLLADPVYAKHVLGVDRLRHLAGALRRTVARVGADVLVVPQVEASVTAWLATRGLGLPMLVPHLHGNPRIEERDGPRRTKLAFAAFRHLVARRVPVVLAVSLTLRDQAARTLATHTPVVYAKNPVRDLGAGAVREPASGTFRFLSVGRLSYQKGQDTLLRALAVARPYLPPATLTLVGQGPEEAALRRLSSELGLDDMVVFAGYASDPARHFRGADGFVLSSRWEGFGVVLVEALSFGLPLLAVDCEFGPSDVVTGPSIGELVPAEDTAALAAGLVRMAGRPRDHADEQMRRDLALGYSRESAAQMHVDVLRQIVRTLPLPTGRLAALR